MTVHSTASPLLQMQVGCVWGKTKMLINQKIDTILQIGGTQKSAFYTPHFSAPFKSIVDTESIEMSEKSYKYRLYPTDEQKQQLEQNFGLKRFVYNYFLAEREQSYQVFGKSPSRFEQDHEWTLIKKHNDWMCEPDKWIAQNAIKDLDSAYTNFFKGRAKYPNFKSKRNKQSYRTSSNVKVNEDSVKLPKLSEIKASIHIKPGGRILSATVSKTPTNKYYVSIQCTDVDIQPKPKTNQSVGMDLGIKHFATLSTGEKIENPKYLSKSERKLKRMCRWLSRKPKDSNNHAKFRVRLAGQYERVSNQRTDFAQKLSTRLVNEFDTIAIEDLKVQNMLKNHHLAKSISDVAWSMFVQMLTYKCDWYGKSLIKRDAYYPSSQICSCCGHKNADVKNLKIREWECPICHTKHDRDINASKNILWGTQESTPVGDVTMVMSMKQEANLFRGW